MNPAQLRELVNAQQANQNTVANAAARLQLAQAQMQLQAANQANAQQFHAGHANQQGMNPQAQNQNQNQNQTQGNVGLGLQMPSTVGMNGMMNPNGGSAGRPQQAGLGQDLPNMAFNPAGGMGGIQQDQAKFNQQILAMFNAQQQGGGNSTLVDVMNEQQKMQVSPSRRWAESDLR